MKVQFRDAAMFRDQDYVTPSDEPYLVVEAIDGDCTWEGCLYERKSGGFDLFYDHENSEFKSISTGTITKLRHLDEAEGGLVYIAHLDAERSRKRLVESAKRRLLEWVSANVPRSI